MVSVGLAFDKSDGAHNDRDLCWCKWECLTIFASIMLYVPFPKFPQSVSVVTVKTKNLNMEI